MLCSRCQEMLNIDALVSEQKSGCLHHPSYTALCEAAEAGCEMCQLIRAEAKQSRFRYKPLEDEYDKDLPEEETRIRWVAFDRKKNVRGIRRVRIEQRKRFENISNDLDRQRGTYPFLFLFFSFEVLPTSPLASLVRGRPIATTSASDACFDQASHWMKNCLQNHPNCPRPKSVLPTRVIDLGGNPESPEVRLLHTHGQHGEWVTLSHCWGTSSPLLTTTSTVEKNCQSLLIEDLPLLYRDAIAVVRRLGLQYLWIDSLCILQDSRADWLVESANMGGIYRNAILNIAAEASPDSEHGIFRSGDEHRHLSTPMIELTFYSVDLNCEGTVYITPDHYYRAAKPLQARAWVLQENMFSPRKLHYHSDELPWSCETALIANESDPEQERNVRQVTAPHSVFRYPWVPEPDDEWGHKELERHHPSVLGLWHRKLSDFMGRQITFNSDRLPAIAGLAKEIAKQTRYDYVAGLWKQDMLSCLLWRAARIGTIQNNHPSWSWAVVHSQQHIPWGSTSSLEAGQILEDDHTRAEVAEVNVKNVNDDPFGQVLSASLTLTGPWRSVQWKEKPLPYFEQWNKKRCVIDRFRIHDRVRDEELTIPEQIVISLDDPPLQDDDPKVMEALIHRQVIYVQLGRYGSHDWRWGEGRAFWALMLEPVDGKEERYRRIGVAQIPTDNTMADGWDTGTFTIV